jgi:hypothetical protein
MNDQKQEVVAISSVEDVGWGVKLKNDKGMTFNVPKMLKDQSAETKAWQVLKNLPGYGMGTQQNLQYVETPNSNGGTSRYVRMIIAGQSAPQIPKASVGPQYQKTFNKQAPIKETDWDKISWGKCKHAFLVELMKIGTTLEQAEPIAENWADASMRKSPLKEIFGDEPMPENIFPETCNE